MARADINNRRIGRTLAALVALGVSVATCSGPTAPSGSSATVVALTIQPQPTGLHVGSKVTLTAMGRYADGRTAPVAASWSSDNPAVLLIDNSGHATAARIGRAAITASAADKSATLEFVVTPEQGAAWSVDFSGTWSGDSLELNCSRLAGPGPSPCEGHYNGGVHLSTVLDVRQQGNSVIAATTIGAQDVLLGGQLSGWISSDGHMYLTGQLSGKEAGTAQFIDSDFAIGASGALVGTYSWTNTFQSAFGSQTLREDWRLLDLTKTR